MTPLSVDIPVFETERLILRAPRMDDFEAHVGYATSDRAKFTGGPFDRWGAWQGFSSALGHWVLFGYGFWMLEEKATGKPAGRVGMIKPEGWPEPELGWHVYAGFEGKGIAYEAAIATRDYAQINMGFAPMISHVDPENTRSRALAERMGAVIEREGELFGAKILIYRHKMVSA